MTSESAGTHDQTPAERQAALDARRAPEGYDVAPLEWEDFIGRAFADSIVGRYQVWFDGRECRASLRPYLSPGHVDTWFGHSSSLDEAKAAAEADYRQRILSALRPRQGTAPAVGGDELTQPPLVFGYTNWRGEYAVRKVIPLRVWYGGTEWHPEPQWLLKALDTEKENAERDFAIKDMSPPIPAPAQGETVEALAERILSALGIAFQPSREPGADRRRDGLVSILDAALRSSEGRGTGWQPIETMPLGQKIDVWMSEVDDKDFTGEGFRLPDVVVDGPVPYRVTLEIAEGEVTTYLPDQNGVALTHWRFAPPPPANPQ